MCVCVCVGGEGRHCVPAMAQVHPGAHLGPWHYNTWVSTAVRSASRTSPVFVLHLYYVFIFCVDFLFFTSPYFFVFFYIPHLLYIQSLLTEFPLFTLFPYLSFFFFPVGVIHSLPYLFHFSYLSLFHFSATTVYSFLFLLPVYLFF